MYSKLQMRYCESIRSNIKIDDSDILDKIIIKNFKYLKQNGLNFNYLMDKVHCF